MIGHLVVLRECLALVLVSALLFGCATIQGLKEKLNFIGNPSSTASLQHEATVENNGDMTSLSGMRFSMIIVVEPELEDALLDLSVALLGNNSAYDRSTGDVSTSITKTCDASRRLAEMASTYVSQRGGYLCSVLGPVDATVGFSNALHQIRRGGCDSILIIKNPTIAYSKKCEGNLKTQAGTVHVNVLAKFEATNGTVEGAPGMKSFAATQATSWFPGLSQSANESLSGGGEINSFLKKQITSVTSKYDSQQVSDIDLCDRALVEAISSAFASLYPKNDDM